MSQPARALRSLREWIWNSIALLGSERPRGISFLSRRLWYYSWHVVAPPTSLFFCSYLLTAASCERFHAMNVFSPVVNLFTGIWIFSWGAYHRHFDHNAYLTHLYLLIDTLLIITNIITRKICWPSHSWRIPRAWREMSHRRKVIVEVRESCPGLNSMANHSKHHDVFSFYWN